MNLQESVILELRSMFREGATPSRLIQHIVSRHPHEGNWHRLIQDYFREGFGIPIVRGLSPSEKYGDINLRYSYLNEDLLHDMVEARKFWEPETNNAKSAAPSWLDSLVATNALDRIREEKHLAPPPDLSNSWSGLSENERKAIVLANIAYEGRTEMVRILARLVERLQQRIVAMESKQPIPSVSSSPPIVPEKSSGPKAKANS